MRVARFLPVALLAVLPSAQPQQDRGAARLDQEVRGITVTGRVLIVGAHPDDDDARLITYLARGHRVEAAYLSLTRGEGGRNLIGNDQGEVLGVIRTAETIAARRIDGGHQFFTRAFDFGYSRSAQETYEHWPHDAVLGDVVAVIRSFRPHVVVARFTGTPADSDGQHEVSALLAREAFDLAADTALFPVARHGHPWQPVKLYGPGQGLTIDVGGFDPVIGKTFDEIAAESRAMHRTQGFSSGPESTRDTNRWVTLRRVASRVAEANGAAPEQGLFDGVDTTFARLFAETPSEPVRNALALLKAYADSARDAMDLKRPETIVRYLALATRIASNARSNIPRCLHPNADASAFVSPRAACQPVRIELDASIDLIYERARAALLTAAGVSLEATADRELVSYSDSLPVTLSLTNHGPDSVQIISVVASGAENTSIRPQYVSSDSVGRWSVAVRGLRPNDPWWLGRRLRDLYPPAESQVDGLTRAEGSTVVRVPGVALPEDIRRTSDVNVTLRVGGVVLSARTGPIAFTSAEPMLGVQERPVSGVPSITLEFNHSLEWVPANKPVDRALRLTLRSFADSTRTLSFSVVAPPGIRIDSLPKALVIQPGDRTDVLLRMRGLLTPGRFEFGVIANHGSDVKFAEGSRTIQYPHLLPIRVSRASGVWLQAVDIEVPPRLNVAYLQGVGDLIAPYLQQLGVHLTIVGSDELPNADLSKFTTVVVGTRAYEAHPELVAANARLLDFARRGGTVVVQHGGMPTYGLGVFPYPMAPAANGALEQVTVETAPVTVVDPGSPLLNWPNRITESDWKGWVTERAAYMPGVIDPHYATPLEMHDAGQSPNRGAIAVTRLGKGMYIYTTLALYRQLGAAVPGSARLFVNLLSAGLTPTKKVAP